MSPNEVDDVFRFKRAQRWTDAAALLEAILTHSPTDAQALTQLADVHVRERHFGEAERALDQAEASAGTTSETAEIRGNLRYGQERLKEAATAYREAAALSTRGTWPLLQLARVHLKLGEFEAAKGAAMQAAERDPASGRPWQLLGEIALKQDCPEAVELLEKAHELSPEDQYIYSKLVEAKLSALPPEERERELETLIRASGDNKHFVRLLAKVRKEAGNHAGAAAAWRSTRLNRGDAFSRKMEAYSLRKAGSLPEAAALFRTCLLEEPEDVKLMSAYISMQTKRGATEELRETLEQMLPIAGPRRGAVYGALRKLGPPPE